MKPSLPKGVRDFTPEQVRKREYIFDKIKKAFRRYGFQPIETPCMENLSTLTGKYGEEGDRLLFKVLNNGDFLAKADEEALQDRNSAKLVPSISKRGLRYDLTVPFARFVVMNQNEIALPFKRYQIQPVWRADRPQKGRYQEFYQCDADVVGSGSLMYDAELALLYDEVFADLNLPVTIKLNNRKILAGMAEAAGIPEKFTEMTVAIDKLDKIGMEGVRKELLNRGIPDEAVLQLQEILGVKDLNSLSSFLQNSETGMQGVEELQATFRYLEGVAINNEITFDITLARGLNYYTGCIYEVKAKDVKMGSIGGGGRYDDLTGVFGLKGVPGTGISFGAERIYDVMEELQLFPDFNRAGIQVLFIAFDEPSLQYAFRCLQQARETGIAADLYPEPAKLKKQMKYANTRQVPFVVLIGKNEMESEMLTLKDMKSGEQHSLPLDEIIAVLKRVNAT